MEARSIKFSYWLTHSLIAASTAAVFYVGWELNAALENRNNLEETQFQARSQLAAFKDKNPFKAIQRSLEKVNPDEARERLKKVDSQMRSLEKMLLIKRGEEMERIFVLHRNHIQDSTSYSRPEELISTLTEKTKRLLSTAKMNAWKNVGRFAEQMLKRLEQLALTGKVESPLVKYVESDLNALNSLIKGSTLDDVHKNELLRMLEGIRQELVMLMDLHTSRRGLQGEMIQAEAATAKWAARAELAIGGMKFRAKEQVDRALTHVWMLGGWLLVSWIALAIAWSVSRRHNRRVADQKIIDVLTFGVLAHEPNVQGLVSDTRLEEVNRMLKVVKKKLALGEDFQSGMPFASVLIDEHGKMIWGNEYFCEQFSIDKDDLLDEMTGWKQLSARFTGLEFDPIEQALSTFESGTWQIQLQMLDGVSIPLEMHVTPIESREVRKVLVVFYQLTLMKETIQTQARIIMEPVRLALEALESENWNVETEQQLAPLWQKAGLGEDWLKLSQSMKRMDQGRFELLQQIRQLEDDKHDHLKLIVELTGLMNKRAKAIKDEMRNLKDVRDGLVSLDQLSCDLGSEHAALMTSARSQVKRTEVMLDMARSVAERLAQAKDAIAQLEQFKQEYRLGKQEIQESKQSLVQIHNRFLSNLPALDAKASQVAADMKDALMRLDKVSHALDNRLAGLDVQITKLAMNFAGPIPDFDKHVHAIDFAAHERVAREIREAMGEDQELIIDRLKAVVDELKDEAQTYTVHKVELGKSGDSVQI